MTQPGGNVDRTKVLYILSWGRSGSTVLGNSLGELDGFMHAGELKTIWGKGVLQDRYCGCGVPVLECEQWPEVLARTCSGDVVEEAKRIYRLQRSAVRLRHTRALIRMNDLSEGNEQLRSYAAVTQRLYASIKEVTGAQVIVDSSKRQEDAALLGLLPEVDPYYVHLVRDPRAVAYSWQRKKDSPGEGTAEEMLRYSPTVSTRNWVLVNLTAEALKRRYGANRVLLVRYEDFVTDPGAVMERILEMIGESRARLPINGHTLQVSDNHTAGGNPGRFRSGSITLRADDEWLRRQPVRDRMVSTALALPILKRYGYRALPRTQRSEI
jgi:hypothetical protein